MFRFEDLRVYQDALKFVDQVYLLTAKWPKEEIYGLTDQFRRASVSMNLIYSMNTWINLHEQ